MDLSVEFMGLKLKNPIIIAAGPLTASGKMMRKAVEAGAGAVITKTITNEVRSNVRPRLVKSSLGMQNIELYSEYSLEEWENEIEEVEAPIRRTTRSQTYKPEPIRTIVRKRFEDNQIKYGSRS